MAATQDEIDELAALKAAKFKIMTGSLVAEADIKGRSIKYTNMTGPKLALLNERISELEFKCSNQRPGGVIW